jgi:hypothetical protein
MAATPKKEENFECWRRRRRRRRETLVVAMRGAIQGC